MSVFTSVNSVFDLSSCQNIRNSIQDSFQFSEYSSGYPTKFSNEWLVWCSGSIEACGASGLGSIPSTGLFINLNYELKSDLQ